MKLTRHDIPIGSIWSMKGDRGWHFQVKGYNPWRRAFLCLCADQRLRLIKLAEIRDQYDRWHQLERYIDTGEGAPI